MDATIFPTVVRFLLSSPGLGRAGPGFQLPARAGGHNDGVVALFWADEIPLPGERMPRRFVGKLARMPAGVRVSCLVSTPGEAAVTGGLAVRDWPVPAVTPPCTLLGSETVGGWSLSTALCCLPEVVHNPWPSFLRELNILSVVLMDLVTSPPPGLRNGCPGMVGKGAFPGMVGKEACPGMAGKEAFPGMVGKGAWPGMVGKGACPGTVGEGAFLGTAAGVEAFPGFVCDGFWPDTPSWKGIPSPGGKEAWFVAAVERACLVTADDEVCVGTAVKAMRPGTTVVGACPGTAYEGACPGTADERACTCTADEGACTGTADEEACPVKADEGACPVALDDNKFLCAGREEAFPGILRTAGDKVLLFVSF